MDSIQDSIFNGTVHWWWYRDWDDDRSSQQIALDISMGGHSRKVKDRKSSSQPSSSPSTSTNSSATSSSGDQFESSATHRKRRRGREREGAEKQSHKKIRRDYEKRKSETNKAQSSRDRKKKKRRERKNKRYDSDEDGGSGLEFKSESPEDVINSVLKEFPAVAGDLEQLLQMIDQGQAVDIKGLSERSLVKHLRRLFTSLNLKEKGDQVFLLPDKAKPTLDAVGRFIRGHIQPPQHDHLDSGTGVHSVQPDSHCRVATDNLDDAIGPRRRPIGPEMPSAELLAAAAKLTEAEAELRETELDGDNGLFIGPPPPTVVMEAASANEAERFEEITRIIDAEDNSLYDIVGVNKNMPSENIKKRYWKLSLMVHPDKCSHPQAHQAFVKLNKAFKDLQDPDKRKVLDDKIKLKEEQEALKVELKQMREAAQWRRLQGISMEGDDILLAEMDAKVAPQRDEWMTSLPPERGRGVSMHSTKRFGKESREGRGDASSWTDTPSERAQKARTNYLEAFNKTTHLASEQGQEKANVDADLVDQYNKANRSTSLLEKHQDLGKNRSKKKIKKGAVKEEWEGSHPWKPWDREKDLAAGRQNVKLGSENMGQGLSSRFSSGTFQRSFL